MSPTGNFLYTQKVTKKVPGRPWTPFCPIGQHQERYRAATEILPGRRPPRNRCGGSRTSPDGPRDEGWFLSCETDRWFYPFDRAGGRIQNRTPPQIRCQKKLVQWLRSGKSAQTDWAKIGVRGNPGGVFTRPQAGAYEANRRMAAALRPSGSLFRRGKSDPGPCRGGLGAKARSGWLRRHRGKRRLLEFLPQFYQAISQNRRILELQHLRRASPRSAAPWGPRWHFTCAAEVNSALRQGFARRANRLYGASAPGKEAAI